MSLLTICQNVAKETGFSSPNSIIGNSDETAIRLLESAKATGRELRKKPWSVLEVEHTFATVASTAAYSLPSDFEWMPNTTVWNRSQNQKVVGPLTPQEWQELKSGFNTLNVTDAYRIKRDSNAKKMFIHPTPESVETIAYEYISNLWVADSGASTAYTTFQADGDVSLIDEDIVELGTKWRFLEASKLPYFETKAEYDLALEQALARDGGSKPILRIGGRRGRHFAAVTPETGAGS